MLYHDTLSEAGLVGKSLKPSLVTLKASFN